MKSRLRSRLFLLLVVLFSVVAGFVDWPTLPDSFLFAQQLNKLEYKLGLDLQGGAHLVYEADTSGVDVLDRDSTIEGVRNVIERRVNAFGVAEPLVQTNKSGDTYRVIVELAGVFDVNEAIAQIGRTPLLEFKEQNPEANVSLSAEERAELDLMNEEVLVRAGEILALASAEGADFEALAREHSEDPSVAGNGGDLGFAGRGDFVPAFEKALFDDMQVGDITPEPIKTQFGYHIIEKLEERSDPEDPLKFEVRGRHILLLTKTEADVRPPSDLWMDTGLTGAQLERAQVQFDQTTGASQVGLQFDSEGKDLFADITERNVGKPVAIFLDGAAISIPTVQSRITAGHAVISGNFTIPEAKELAQNLNAGALPIPIHLVSQQTVGPTLGQISLQKSLTAGLWGLLLVALFMIFVYRLPGLIAVVALAMYTVLTLFFFQLFSITLTLAGVAGFILSIGMAVDANILIFERMKEELRKGKPLTKVVEDGFGRAWPSIRDSNMSSLITCAILFWFGSSLIKGFALTLGLGILVSMFSAITLTRGFLQLFVGAAMEKRRGLFSSVKAPNGGGVE